MQIGLLVDKYLVESIKVCNTANDKKNMKLHS